MSMKIAGIANVHLVDGARSFALQSCGGVGHE